MSKKVKISKLVLEIGGKKIELSMKQAKELQEVLNDSFGDTEIVFRDRWYADWYAQTKTHLNTSPYYARLTCGGDAGAAIGGDVMNATAGSFQGASISGNLAGDTMTLTAQ